MTCQDSTNAILHDSETRGDKNGTEPNQPVPIRIRKCGVCASNKEPCMCCHLPTLRCTTLYVVVTSALRTEAAPHLHERARLRPIEKRRTPLCREKVKKYTLPLNALTKRNPRRSICRRLRCILSPGCSADQSMILRRYGVQLETPLPSPSPFQH